MLTISAGSDIKQPNKLRRRDTIARAVEFMKSDEQSFKVFDLRTTLDDAERKGIKTSLPYIVPAHFKNNSRRASDLEVSNCLILDIDHVDVSKHYPRLKKEPLIHFMFRSPSGDGIKVGIKFSEYVTDPEIYKLVYKKCAYQFEKYYQLKTDNTSDAARACFLAGDADIYYNPDSALWKPTYDKPEVSTTKYDYSGEPDVEELASICRGLYINDYHDWVKAGIALSSLGEKGRDLFKLLSLGKGAKDTERQIDRKFDTFMRCDRVGIGTFYYIASQYGGKR